MRNNVKPSDSASDLTNLGKLGDSIPGPEEEPSIVKWPISLRFKKSFRFDRNSKLPETPEQIESSVSPIIVALPLLPLLKFVTQLYEASTENSVLKKKSFSAFELGVLKQSGVFNFGNTKPKPSGLSEQIPQVSVFSPSFLGTTLPNKLNAGYSYVKRTARAARRALCVENFDINRLIRDTKYVKVSLRYLDLSSPPTWGGYIAAGKVPAIGVPNPFTSRAPSPETVISLPEGPVIGSELSEQSQTEGSSAPPASPEELQQVPSLKLFDELLNIQTWAFVDYCGKVGGKRFGRSTSNQTMATRADQRTVRDPMARTKLQIQARQNTRGFTTQQINAELSSWWFEELVIPTSLQVKERALLALETYMMSERMLFGTIFNYKIDEWIEATSARRGIPEDRRLRLGDNGSVCANSNFQVPTGLQTLKEPRDVNAPHHRMLSQIFDFQGIPTLVSPEAWLLFHYNIITNYRQLLETCASGVELPATPAEIQRMKDNFPHICLDPSMVDALGLPRRPCRAGSTMGPPYQP